MIIIIIIIIRKLLKLSKLHLLATATEASAQTLGLPEQPPSSLYHQQHYHFIVIIISNSITKLSMILMMPMSDDVNKIVVS